MSLPVMFPWKAGLLLIVFIAFLSSAPVCAQQASASVNGVIYDGTGAAVSDAAVKLTNVDTGVVQAATSNRSGAYIFLNVTPGVYTVTVEKTGFANVAQSQVKLDINQTATFDFHLKVGSTQETVEVRADAVAVESSTSELGTVIGAKQVVDLPLNGRNFTQLLTLTPGAAPVSLDQTGSGGGGFAGNALGAFSFPAINGQRVRSNIFLLDGVNNQNTFLSTNNYTPIPDAIGEFKVQTHNDDSQYGGVVGGIINVVSKSGTNNYHGTVWEFLRNEKMDANAYFSKFDAANVKPRDPLRQNVFGASLGGPISIPKLYNGKDRTFFYAAYEGYRFRGKNQLTQRAATPAMRAGDFGVLCTEGFAAGLCLNRDHQIYDPYSTMPDPANPGAYIRSPFLNNKITRALDPTALAYQAIFPQGVKDANDPFYTVNATGSVKDDQDEGQIRVDQTLGSHDQIFARYAKYYQLITRAQTVVQTHLAPLYGNNWTVHETHTFGSSAILDGYIARNYGNNEQTLVLPGEPALIAALQKTGVSPAYLTVGDLGLRAPAIGFNNGNYTSIGFHQSQATGLADVWEYGGNFTKVVGRHIVKVGGAITTNGFYSPIRGSHETFDPRQTAGVGVNVGHGGDSYASFLLGAPTNGGNRIVNERVHGGYSDNAYIHDQWKATKNLTVNLGLRYDLKLWPVYGPKTLGVDSYSGEPNPTTGEYILTYLPPNCSATQGAPCIPTGNFVSNGGKPTPYNGLPPHVVVAKNGSILSNDYGDIGVRVGLAYRVNDTLAIRAGYGRFYDTWGAAAQDAQNFNGNWPATSLELNGLNPVTVTDPITDPIHLGGAGGGIVYPSVDPYHAGTWSVDPNYKTPYSDQYNFGLQQELPGNVLLDMNYVGAISRRLDVTDVLNVAPTPGPGDPVAREPFPYMGNAWFQQSIGNANFNALEVSLNKRATRNLAFLVSYTWSKSIDDGCSGDIGAGCSIQNVYDRSKDRSVSAFDIPHVFSASFTATSPYGKGRNLDNRFVNALVGGWAINGIITLHSGVPYDVGAPNSIPNICNCANSERSSVIGDPRATGPKNINTTWFNTANVVVPAPYTFGTMGRYSLRSDRWRNTDLSFFRQFNVGLGEARYFEFRAEAFNVFNGVVFGIPNRDRGDSATFGRVRGAAIGPRQLQVALKIVF